MTSWKENAKAYLQQCYDHEFYREFEFEKGKSLCQVIGAAIYGEQADGENVDGSDDKFGYSPQRTENILKIQNKICELSPTSKIRLFKKMIYIYIDEKNQRPTMAFKFKAKKSYVFIDASARVYSSWGDFLDNNKLPECQIAYTNDGQFETDKSAEVLVKFVESPACTAVAKLAGGADITASFVGVATTAVGLAGCFFPLTAPFSFACFVSSALTGLYGAGRSINTLIDRDVHEESIWLTDSEARLHWLNLVTAPLAVMGSIATMATTRITASGRVMSSTTQIFANSAIFSSFGMCSLNVINNLVNLVEKKKNGELTVQDVSSFIISLSFWINLPIHFKIASWIITTIVNIIKCIEVIIPDLKDAVEVIITAVKPNKKVITPVPKDTCELINCKAQTDSFNKVKGIKSELQRDSSMQTLAKILNVSNLQGYQCNGKKIFKDLKTHEKKRMIQIENTLSQTDEIFQRIAIAFAEQNGAESVGEFSSFVEYCMADLHSQKKDVEMSNRPNNISKKDFQLNEVSSKYIDKDNKITKSGFQSLHKKYQEDYQQSQSANDGIAKGFKTANATTYHEEKHGHNVGLTAEQYMAKIQEVVDNATTTLTSLTQEGNAHTVSYKIEVVGSTKQIQVLVIIDVEKNENTMISYD